MSIETQAPSQAPDAVLDSYGPETRSSAWKWLVVFGGVLVVIAAAATLMRGSITAKGGSTQLTHTITRDDLLVTVTETGTLESSSNTEIKCKVKGGSTVLWVIESGTRVEPGDELVRLDQSSIEDTINAQKITHQNALATFAQSESNVAVAKISITEYLEGTFRTELATFQKDLAIAESNLRTTKNMVKHTTRMFRKGYVTKLEVEGNEFAQRQAELELEVKQTEIDVLNRFTKAKMLEELKSTLKAAEAKLAADNAALDLEKARLERAERQLENCIIVAESSGMVIHPNAAQWKEQPEVEEGATVREDQVLLIIPDLTKMQVKVGIHEAKVDRLKPGLLARIELQDEKFDGEVESIASVTRPAGWWTGNVVKYDTIIKLDPDPRLKPGMSAAVEVVLAEHRDVVTMPVAAVVEGADGAFSCWVETETGASERALQLGDSNDQFVVVNSGLKEGDKVVLNPIAYIEDAQADALKPGRGTGEKKRDSGSSRPGNEGEAKPAGKPGGSKPQGGKPPKKPVKPLETKPEAKPAKPEAKPAKPEAKPAKPEANPVKPGAKPAA